MHTAPAGSEGMTGNRGQPGTAIRPHRTLEHTATHNRKAPRSRRDDSAPLGIGVKAKPASRVDLRSSLDPDPSPAYARTQPETGTNRSQNSPAPRVDTAPLLQG